MPNIKQPLPQMNYFKEEDILHLLISEEPESASIEISPNVTAELNADGELIGVEILNASHYIRDFILESVQGKLLNLAIKPR
ncbi:MAG: DNA polymerase III subunit alpha [Leptolyngbya sp.]|nr:MAG: DNA polymerase III subunit alpha [Leptolyngbya sp.]